MNLCKSIWVTATTDTICRDAECGIQVDGTNRNVIGHASACLPCMAGTFILPYSFIGQKSCAACKICRGETVTACTATMDTICQSDSTAECGAQVDGTSRNMPGHATCLPCTTGTFAGNVVGKLCSLPYMSW